MTDVLAPDTGTAGRRRRAPRGQGEKLRAEILCAAERLLRETGDQEAVSIRGVADAVRAAGIVCFGQIGFSPFLVGLCGERGVAVSFLTERGRFLARMEGKTARVTASKPSTLTAMTDRTSSADASSTAPSNPRPALFTSTSTRPNRSSARATAS